MVIDNLQPLTLDTLKEKNRELYEALKEFVEDLYKIGMTKKVVIENAKCDYCGKEIAPGQPVYTMSIDFTSYLSVSGKDRRAVEEVTGDTLAKDGDTYEYDLCENCYWRLKDFIHKGLKKQQHGRRGLSTNNNGSIFLALWPLKIAAFGVFFL